MKYDIIYLYNKAKSIYFKTEGVEAIMEKRILGKTDFEVSVVGFGGIPAQRLDKEQVLELLIEAYNQGMNFIDTARGYMASEELIGYALEQLGRDKFYLATKSMSRTYEGIIEGI